MFGRATIRLGIGPHSSLYLNSGLLFSHGRTVLTAELLFSACVMEQLAGACVSIQSTRWR